jgi:hypothetical protein
MLRPGSVVGKATGYGLGGPRIESLWRRVFRTCPDRPWSPPSLLYSGYRVFHGGKERPGSDADPSPPSSACGQERVELYLYSPYGPYGLYRASVPVQGCTLPLPFTYLSRLYYRTPFQNSTASVAPASQVCEYTLLLPLIIAIRRYRIWSVPSGIRFMSGLVKIGSVFQNFKCEDRHDCGCSQIVVRMRIFSLRTH